MFPLSVEIINDKKPLKVGDHRTIGCEVKGARPRPVVTWWMDYVRVNELNKVVSIGFLLLPLQLHLFPSCSELELIDISPCFCHYS